MYLIFFELVQIEVIAIEKLICVQKDGQELKKDEQVLKFREK